jgi:hypothetical protein
LICVIAALLYNNFVWKVCRDSKRTVFETGVDSANLLFFEAARRKLLHSTGTKMKNSVKAIPLVLLSVIIGVALLGSVQPASAFSLNPIKIVKSVAKAAVSVAKTAVKAGTTVVTATAKAAVGVVKDTAKFEGAVIKETGKVAVGAAEDTVKFEGAVIKETGKVAVGAAKDAVKFDGAVIKETGKIAVGAVKETGQIVENPGKFAGGVVKETGEIAGTVVKDAVKYEEGVIKDAVKYEGAVVKETGKVAGVAIKLTGAAYSDEFKMSSQIARGAGKGLLTGSNLLGSGILKIATAKDPLRAMDQVAVLNTPLAPSMVAKQTFHSVKDPPKVSDLMKDFVPVPAAVPGPPAIGGMAKGILTDKLPGEPRQSEAAAEQAKLDRIKSSTKLGGVATESATEQAKLDRIKSSTKLGGVAAESEAEQAKLDRIKSSTKLGGGMEKEIKETKRGENMSPSEQKHQQQDMQKQILQQTKGAESRPAPNPALQQNSAQSQAMSAKFPSSQTQAVQRMQVQQAQQMQQMQQKQMQQMMQPGLGGMKSR